MKKDLSIYIHIPFCYSKCYYCDFNSSTVDENIEKYIVYIKKEIDLYSEILNNHRLKTIFFGGGTPSFIDEMYIVEVLEYIYTKIDATELVEVTVESNPKTLNLEKLKAYKSAGVNRISLGVQTLDDDLLKSIGRAHTSSDVYSTHDLLKECGFKNINMDIMFNLPGQQKSDLLDSLEKVSNLDIPHISLYSLSIEEGTPFHEMEEKGEISLSSEDVEREMYHSSIEFLKSKDYHQYEISNFAKEGYECIHNLAYWKLKPYIGLGLSSHSNISSMRYGNVSDFDSYFKSIDTQKLPIDEDTKEFIDKDMEIAEYIMLGLRLNEGIYKEEFKNRYKIDIVDIFKGKLEKFKRDGLIIEDQFKLRLTDKGLDICNVIFMEILPEK